MLPQSEQRPGLPCPECGFLIELSIPQLLRDHNFMCAGCGLVLALDRQESRTSMQALSQLQVAIDNLDMVKNQYSGD